MTWTRRLLPAALALAAVLAGGATPASAAECAQTSTPGGDWRSFGHDYANTRHQDKEKVLSVGDAPLLSPVWTFATGRAGGEGDITGTPVVADGCLYTATARGWVFAVNADTGELVWKAQVPYGGSINSTPGLADRVCGTKRVAAKSKAKKAKKKKTKSKRKRKARSSATRKRKKAKPKKRKRRTKVTYVRCATVYVAVSRTAKATGCPEGDPCVGPYIAAFDQRTGRLEWATRSLDSQAGADVYGSPVIFEDTLLIGTSGGSAELGDEADRYAFQGSLSLLDAGNGKERLKTWTIHPPMAPDDEFAGAGIWSTPAIDPEAKVAYIGTANPFKPQAEHQYANSILKYDVDRSRPTFGNIIGSYKGLVDEYLPGLSQVPCYDIPGNPAPYYPQGLGACGDIDLDFGASPNLFTLNGRKVVGAGQKSGVYHLIDAETMKPVWTQIVGPPGSLGGIVGSTAYDGQAIYGPITVPGYVWSIDAATGGYRWVGPVADGAHWGPPVAVANGVVYTVDLMGTLDAYDARNGALIAKRPLVLGGSGIPSLSWGGVSVARNTIYATVGITGLPEGYIVAFRPGGVDETVADAQQTLTGLGGGGGGGGGAAPAGSAIVAIPGSVYSTYGTPVMVTNVGGPLSFVNLDLPAHDVVADAKAPDGTALFSSRLGGLGEVVPVEGLDRVSAGQSYGFYCSLHPGMRGTLVVR